MPTGPPPPGAVATSDGDTTTYRPLIGGARITTLDAFTGGTLGCLLRDPANHESAYALTNQHVLKPADIAALVLNVTKIGNPSGEYFSKHCWNDIIGVWAGGAVQAGDGKDRDEALVRLLPGMRWVAEIVGIGPVAGTHDLTADEVTSGTYAVRKRGQATGLTGGTVIAVNATTSVADNQIVIRPNADPAAKRGQVVYFGWHGDSGSAVVNDANEVVGLLYARDDEGLGYAFPIGKVLERFAAIEKITVEVATATAPGQVHTQPGGAITGEPGAVRPDPGVVRVRADLSASAAGRMLLGAWQAHQDELTRLVGTDRRVIIAWRRGGAALAQSLLRLAAHPDRTLPDTLAGRPVMACVDALHEALSRGASAALRTDLDRVRGVLPDLAGLSYSQIVTALAAR